MFIATIPNRNSPPAILLRESYREAGKVKTRTLANLSKLPPEAIEAVRCTLKGQKLLSPEEAFEIPGVRGRKAAAYKGGGIWPEGAAPRGKPPAVSG